MTAEGGDLGALFVFSENERLRAELEKAERELTQAYEHANELEGALLQAERERDENKWPRLDHWRDRAKAAEAQLAKVPALLEGIRGEIYLFRLGEFDAQGLTDALDEVLDAFEQEQKP